MTINCNELLANFCTVDKCAELEAKINFLEQKIESLALELQLHREDKIPNAHQYDSNLKIDGSFISNVLTITIADLTSSDTTQISIPNPEIPEIDLSEYLKKSEVSVEVDVFEQENGNAVIKVQVIDQSDEDTLLLNNQDLNVEHDINFSINGTSVILESEVTVNGKNAKDSDFIGLDFAISLALKGETLQLSGKFLDQPFFDFINLENLVQTIVINNNDQMTCDLTQLEDLINNLDSNLTNKLSNLEFTIDTVSNNINDITDKVEVIDDCVCTDISGNTAVEFECLPPSENEPNYTTNNNTLNYSGIGIRGLHELLQTVNNNLLAIYTASCEQLNQESTDVVSIVASDRDARYIKSTVLVLHFVTLDNYPKRSKNSSYRQIQIPAAKESYDWINDFESLRWYQGNTYAELKFEENYVPVSGFFENATKANEYFDAVLTLTTATENNRVIYQYSQPNTSIAVRETRPYRAFIKSVNAFGQAICEASYKPIINNNE